MDPEEYQRRVDEFKADVQNMDAIRVIRKHITTGVSAVLTSADYYGLRDRVATYFRVHPSEVVVVGSCRTGFSLKPGKRYEPFGAVSDIDIAIVSAAKFDSYWELVFEHWQSHRPWAETRRYRVFLQELFQGWIWPRRLPPRREFEDALKWVEFEDELGRVLFGGMRSVGARLYRSWERLEAYQAIHVLECRKMLVRQNEQ